MAQTFDIRFARSAGLAAMLEVPENAFRWKGGGKLRIDAHGISIGLKRGLLALFGGKHTHRIPTENLRAVYREGDALRVEFQDGKTARIVLPFWARDRDTAAQIVRLLPTSQTVETEDTIHSAKPRADWRMLLSLGVAAVAIGVGAWAVYQRTQAPASYALAPTGDLAAPEVIPPTSEVATPQVETPAPVLSAKPGAQRVEAPAFPLDNSLPKVATGPAYVESRNGSSSSTQVELPVASTSASYAVASPDMASSRASRVRMIAEGIVPIAGNEAARRQLDLFLAESDALSYWYRDGSQNTTGKSLEELWEKVTIRIHNSPDFDDPALKPLQEIELAVSRAWRRAFSLRNDPALLASGDAEIDFALMLQARAARFVD